MKVDFGTDGWRARMDGEFTPERVDSITASISQYLVEANFLPTENRVIVGFDTRENSEDYAKRAADVLTSAGFHVLMSERDVPTPVIAYSVKHWSACGAIMITASHNPPEWNGIKFIPSYAGPANKEITSRIQNLILEGAEPEAEETGGELERIDPYSAYFENIRAMLDAVGLSTSKIKVVYDPMHATGRGYVDRLLKSFGVDVTTINSDPDPKFGGQQPDPSEERLGDLKKTVQDLGADIGLATDGDSDRISAVGPDGRYISPNMLFPLLASNAQSKKRGGIVRTVATTSAVDALAERLKVKVFEVPVGFKYIAPYLMDQKATIGGEESGGFGYWDHVPEKDGILTSLRIVELLAQEQVTMTDLLDSFAKEYGNYFSSRIQVPLSDDMREKISKGGKELGKIIGQKPKKTVRTDGLKLYLQNGGWVLVRPSGTEPVARIYAEAKDPDEVEKYLEAGRELLT